MNLKLFLVLFLVLLLLFSIELSRQTENFEDANENTTLSEDLKSKLDEYHQQTIQLSKELDEKVLKKNKQKCNQISFAPLKNNFPTLKGISSGFECTSKNGTWNKKTNICCNAYSDEKLKEMKEERLKNIKKRMSDSEDIDSSKYQELLDDSEKNIIDGVSKDEFNQSPENVKKALIFNNPQFMTFHSTTS